MNVDRIRTKFGDAYRADERTFTMGIDRRFTTHFAERFRGLYVLETCTGAGFTTISLAKTARQVCTIEIDPSHQEQAISNAAKAGCSSRVSFIQGDILNQNLLDRLPPVDAAFLDPDWNVTGPDHVYCFLHSNTMPPADILLNKIFQITNSIALVLPPFINTREFVHLPQHERQKCFLGDSHELYCLYFGDLIASPGETEFHVPE